MLLGLVQGVTEFLPISSSGHLLLVQHLFGVNPYRFGLAFDMTLHLGTLLAVVWYFRTEVLGMALALARSLPRPSLSDPQERLAYLVLAATAPAAITGFALKGLFETSLRSPWVVVVGLAISGTLFLFAEEMGARKRHRSTAPQKAASMSFSRAVVIGLGQVASLVYGVSRSGSTLAFGLLVGLKRTEAAKFSFLMSIPITAGAVAAESTELARADRSTAAADGLLALHGTGLLVSAVAAYLTIRFLLAFFARHTLRPFAYYCLTAAAVVAAALLATGG